MNYAEMTDADLEAKDAELAGQIAELRAVRKLIAKEKEDRAVSKELEQMPAAKRERLQQLLARAAEPTLTVGTPGQA